MYRVARAIAAPELRFRILSQVLDRLAVRRHGRAHFYAPAQTPDEIHRFVRDFVAYAHIPDDDLQTVEAGPLERPIDGEVVRALQVQAQSAVQRARHVTRLRESGSIVIDLHESSDESILGFGWSHPESWGTWSDGEEVTLRIPVPDDSRWQATVEARIYAPAGQVTIGYAAEGQALQHVEPGSGQSLDYDRIGRTVRKPRSIPPSGSSGTCRRSIVG